MKGFAKYKSSNLESSFCLSLDQERFSVSEHAKFECRVAGPWLLYLNRWLDQMMIAREKNREMFFSRFPPSIESLSNYLINGPLNNEAQILFLIADHSGDLYGHIGLKIQTDGTVEVDNVLRTSEGVPGVMKVALDAIMRWGNEHLGFKQYFLKVISTNRRAINLYSELGFTLRERWNLRMEMFPNGSTNLSPSSTGEADTEEEMFIMVKSLE